jgi:hypothetical protein
MLKSIRNILLMCILFSIIPFALPTTSYACSCAPPPSVEEALQQKTAVFSGKVINMKEYKKFWGSSADPVEILFEVTGAWKGVKQSEVIVNTEISSASCGYNFEMNKEYLVYAYGDEYGLKTGLCERTKLISAAADDLAVLGEGDQNLQQVNPAEQEDAGSTNILIIWGAVSLLIFTAIILFIRNKRK